MIQYPMQQVEYLTAIKNCVQTNLTGNILKASLPTQVFYHFLNSVMPKERQYDYVDLNLTAFKDEFMDTFCTKYREKIEATPIVPFTPSFAVSPELATQPI